ncbi:MAG: hypothetical protein JWQ95_2341, partial [Sphaerisporangium sp.]|nr:hypothetical protein [Sphaerisporangium sp.]
MHKSRTGRRQSALIKGQPRRLAAAALTASSLFASLLWVGTASAQAGPSPQPKPSHQTAAQSELAEAVQKVNSTGQPVQLPSKTTETSISEVTPEGKISTRITSGPVRVKDANGNWHKIDTDLMPSGNSLRPKVAKADIEFSAGGNGPFAQFHRSDGTSLSLGWDGQLPQPAIERNKAIYRGVAAEGAGDLVVTALPAGLRFDVVLNRRPTGPVEVRIPVTAEGLTVGKAADGQLTIKDGPTVIASSSTPVLYDAVASHAYKPRKGNERRSPQSGQHRTAIATAVEAISGGKALVLKPSAEFLADPATAYPVTVDPSVVLPLYDDTDVNSVFDGNNVSGEYLKAGTEADGEKARTYLRFNTQGLKTPTSAVLKLTNIDAPSCGATVGAGIQVRRVTDFWDATKQTWAPQPTNTTEDAVTSTEGSQLGFCGSGTMTWDITAIVAKWAAGTPNHGLVLQSPTEVASTNYRVFASAENIDGLQPPVLEVTSDEVITPGEGDDPADPGPAPSDLWPGRADTGTGVWITDATDFTDTGLIVTRSHSAGQRMDAAQANQTVLGPNWRLEPLGNLLISRLKDFSANGYIQIATGTSSTRLIADPAQPGTFVADDGTSTAVKNADGSFTQTITPTEAGAPTITYTWTKVGTDYLITKIGSADGTLVITYDAQGRFSRLRAPASPQGDCSVSPALCASVTFQYATSTTATSTQLGDITGQLKAISYTPAGGVSATAVTYAYDTAKRLRQVNDVRQLEGEPIKTSIYTYDTQGNINTLNTPDLGSWTLTYESVGKLSSAQQQTSQFAAAATSCRYMDQYLYGRDGCNFGPVPMEYGGRLYTPGWKTTP